MHERSVQKWLVVLVVAAVGLLATGCRKPATEGADPSGSPRIVALSPGVAETLAALGLGDSIVGRHAFDEFTPKAVPAVGDQAGIDYEALLRVRPTHVLLEESAAGAPPRLLELSKARDFEVRIVPMLSLDEIRESIGRLPALVGSAEAEADAASLLARLDAALGRADGFGERAGRMLALYWTRPIGAAGPGSYHAEIVLSLGGSLALDEGAPYRQLDPEDVRRLDPDSIALFVPGADPGRLEELLAPLRALDLRAVREGRVALVSHPRCQTPGPSAIETAESLREAVRAWPPLARN